MACKDVAGAQQAAFGRLIVAVGRQPVSDDLGLDAAGAYAIGDVVRGPMLAQRASEDGIAVAEGMAGHHCHVDYGTVPWVIYTWPEVPGSVAPSRPSRPRACRIRQVFFRSRQKRSGARLEAVQGQVKLFAHAQTDRVPGVHIIDPHASELIVEAVVTMEFYASSEDIARIVHAHPTLSEALHEAALVSNGGRYTSERRRRGPPRGCLKPNKPAMGSARQPAVGRGFPSPRERPYR